MLSISVVIPTHNRAETLARALRSVLSQTRQADEVIVVDDGSIDNTKQLVLEQFPEVIYCYQKNRGVSAARNKGIELATCSWIAFLDSDDQWLESKLERQAAAWSGSQQSRLVHSDEIWIRDGVRVNKPARYKTRQGRIYRYCLPLCAISPSSAVIEKSLLMEMGGFDERFRVCEDYDLWLKICASYPVVACPEPLLIKYGGHADQLSTATWGLDQYRVQALHNMVHSTQFEAVLSADEQQNTYSVLRQKLEILIKGAKKRGNQGLAESAQTKLNLLPVSKS